MPIAVQTQADGGEVNATSMSWSHYVTGSSRGLFVLLAFDNTGVGNISGSYNGVWMEPVIPGGVPDGDDGTVWGFYLANPDTGNNTVFVDFNNVVINTHGYSVQLVDCDTTDLIDTTGSASNISAGNPTQSVTTNNNNSMLIDIYKHEQNSLGSGPQESGQTQIYDHDNGTWIGGCSYRPTTTAGSYAMTWDGGLNDSWCQIVIAVNEAGAQPQTVNLNTLQLQSNTPDITVQAGAATISANTLELNASAPALDIVIPPITILVNTLSIQAQTNDVAVSPGAVSSLLDTLNIDASAQALTVSPGASTIAVDTLRLTLIGLHKDWLKNLERDDLIGYWPQDEVTGSVSYDYSPEGNNGVYAGVDLADSPGPDDIPVPFFDGITSDYNSVISANLESDFNGSSGTMSIWIKATDADVWTDNQARRVWNMQTTGGIGSNNIRFEKLTNNNFRVIYQANTINKIVDMTITDTDWFMVTLTWNFGDDEVRVYKDGVQQGATLTGLGSWSGNFTAMCIGASSTAGAEVWDGWLAHPALWTKALSPSQIAEIYSLPRGSIQPIQIDAGAAITVTNTLPLQALANDVTVSPNAVSTTLDTLKLQSFSQDIAVVLGESTVSLDTLLLQSYIDDISIVAGAVSNILNTLSLDATILDLNVSPSAVISTLDTLLLQSIINDSAIVAGEATINTDTLNLYVTANSIAISPSAVSTGLDTILLQSIVNDITISIGASTISLDTLLLQSSTPNITVTPDTVSIQLGSLELSVNTVNLDVVTVTDLTVALNTLLLLSNPQAITISPSATTLALDTLLLNATANDIDILLGAVSIILDTLSVNANAIDLNVSPGAVTSQMDTLLLNALANDLNVSPAAVSQLLDTLLLQSIANEISIVIGAATVSVDTLSLLSNILDVTVSPGAVTTTLDTLLLQGTANNITVSTVFPTVILDTLALEANAVTTVIAPAAATLSLDTLLLDADILDIIAQVVIQTVSGGVTASDSLISDILSSDTLISDVMTTDSDNA